MPPKKEHQFDLPGSQEHHPKSDGPNLDTSSIPRFYNPNSKQPSHHSQTSPEKRDNPAPQVIQKPMNSSNAISGIDLSPQKKKSKVKSHYQSLRRKSVAKKRSDHYRTIRFAIISFSFFLILFNFQFIFSQLTYLLTPKKNTTPSPVSRTVSTVVQQQAETTSADNVIIIPKIGVSAPLVFIDTLNEQDLLDALQNGVVHYAGTANPGENGNAVFFGHSSNDWWQKGNYKFIFVLLEKLNPGDQYEIHYQSRKYVYQIESTQTVAPTDLSVLSQTSTPYSTLITCTPPGTSWKRFIVKAKQISPASVTTQTVVTNTQAQGKILPSASPSIWEQIGISFSNLVKYIFGQSNPEQPAPGNQGSPSNHLPGVSVSTMPTTF